MFDANHALFLRHLEIWTGTGQDHGTGIEALQAQIFEHGCVPSDCPF